MVLLALVAIAVPARTSPARRECPSGHPAVPAAPRTTAERPIFERGKRDAPFIRDQRLLNAEDVGRVTLPADLVLRNKCVVICARCLELLKIDGGFAAGCQDLVEDLDVLRSTGSAEQDQPRCLLRSRSVHDGPPARGCERLRLDEHLAGVRSGEDARRRIVNSAEVSFMVESSFTEGIDRCMPGDSLLNHGDSDLPMQ